MGTLVAAAFYVNLYIHGLKHIYRQSVRDVGVPLYFSYSPLPKLQPQLNHYTWRLQRIVHVSSRGHVTNKNVALAGVDD